MTAYIARRVVQAIPVLFGISLAAFVLVHVAPGDPAKILLGAHASPGAVAALHHKLGLDKSLPVQYVDFLKGAITLSFGQSIVQRTGVGGLLAQHAAVTVQLLVYAVIISLLVAVPLAIVSAMRRNRLADHSIRLFSMVTFAMPAFWLGILLVLVVSLDLGLLPSSGYATGFIGHLRSLTLPAITIGLYLAPILLRTLRGSMIETLRTEHVEAARARGLSRRRVLMRHVLRNSLTATITVLGVQVGWLLSGAVVVEQVFALPGLGSLLVSSVVARDFPVISALTLLFGVIVVLINLLTDLSYAVLDPRVRLA